MLEIERKFLIDSFPELPVWEEKRMWQGYLATAPVVRIRRTQTADAASCVLCIKGEGSLIRKEIELPLSREQFEELAGLLEGPMKKFSGYTNCRAGLSWSATALTGTGRRRFGMQRWNFPPKRRQWPLSPRLS